MKLVGHKSNRDGIGAQVEVVAGGSGSSASAWPVPAICRRTILASTSAWARQRRCDELTVTWPSGVRQVFENPPIDRVITVEEK